MKRREPAGNCWPTDAQRVLLRAALLDGEVARDAFDAWARHADLRTLDEGSRRLLPLLWRNALRLGVVSPLLPALRDAHRRSWSRNQVLLRRVAGIIAVLEAAGVRTMVLKGVPLALQTYDDVGARPMADVDILVAAGDLDAAVRRLREHGWQPSGEPLVWPPDPLASWPFADAGRHELDLHWRPFHRDYSALDDLWAAAVPMAIGTTGTRALDPAAQVLHTIAHGLAWNPVPSIRWIADSVMLLRRHTPFDWARLVQQARQRRLVLELGHGIRYIATHFDVAVPPAVMAALDAPAPRGERIAFWARTSPGMVAAACRVWADHRTHARHAPAAGPRLGFWRFLAAQWQVDSTRRLLAVLTARVQARRAHARSVPRRPARNRHA